MTHPHVPDTAHAFAAGAFLALGAALVAFKIWPILMVRLLYWLGPGDGF